jgi:hypothetical protein
MPVEYCESAVAPTATTVTAELTGLRARIREIAQSRVCYGYRKILVLLRREGWQVGKHLVYRLYK